MQVFKTYFQKHILRKPIFDAESVFEHLFTKEQYPKPLSLQVSGHPDVLDLFYTKKENWPKGTKLGVLATGGGLSGNISAGLLCGMFDIDMLDVFDGGIGVSAGVANVMAMFGNGQEEVTKIYREDLTKEYSFLQLPKDPLKRMMKIAEIIHDKNPKDPLLDIRIITQHMKTNRPVYIDYLKKLGKPVVAVLMNVDTGKAEYIDVCKMKDPFRVMEAAMNLPGITAEASIKLENGKSYIDGSYAESTPIDYALSQYTHVLVLENIPVLHRERVLEQLSMLIYNYVAKGYQYNDYVLSAVHNFTLNHRKNIVHLENVIRENNPQKRVAIIEPTNYVIGYLDDNEEKLTHAFWESREFARELFTNKEFAAMHTNTKLF